MDLAPLLYSAWPVHGINAHDLRACDQPVNVTLHRAQLAFPPLYHMKPLFFAHSSSPPPSMWQGHRVWQGHRAWQSQRVWYI